MLLTDIIRSKFLQFDNEFGIELNLFVQETLI